jgi:hypothetical protein
MLQLPSTDRALQRFLAQMAAQRELTPLFVEQALWVMFTQGALLSETTPGRWGGQWNLDPDLIAATRLPLSVRDAIGSRASRLTTETLRILGVAAVSGKEFDVEVVARAAEADAGSVLFACEQAGGEGFVQQVQEQERVYLADGDEAVAGYRFTHDRYREAILEHLPPRARKQIHGALARALLKRYSGDEQTEPHVAEHYYGAEEYAQAYMHARQVAERAFSAGEHERAAQYFQLALDSHQKSPRSGRQALPQEFRNQAAHSLHAVGKLSEAEAQLKALLAYPELPELLRLDCQRQLAESYFQQQDYKRAVAPMLQCLEQMGVRFPEPGLPTVRSALHGLFAALFVAPTGWFFNTGPAPNAAREALVMQTLFNLLECGLFVDVLLVLRVVNCGIIRLTREGLHPFSGAWFGALVTLLSSAGMAGLARRCDERTSAMFPECESFADTAFENSEARTPVSDVLKRSYNATALTRMMAHTIIGDCAGSHSIRLEKRFREGLASIAMTTDLRRRWLTMNTCAIVGLFTGRIGVFSALMRAVLDLVHTYNQVVMEEVLRGIAVGSEAFLNGQFEKAQAAFQHCHDVAEKWGDRSYAITSGPQALLCEALRQEVPPLSLAEKASARARDYLDTNYSCPGVWGQSGALAAATLTLFRQGVRRAPPELAKLMRRAWLQCRLEHHQRPVYRAAQATLAAISGNAKRRNEYFALGTKEAEADGLLYHLLWVLRIAVIVLPAASAEGKYYQQWHDQLQSNLHQPPVKLHDLTAVRLPPAPSSGRPMGPPP